MEKTHFQVFYSARLWLTATGKIALKTHSLSFIFLSLFVSFFTLSFFFSHSVSVLYYLFLLFFFLSFLSHSFILSSCSHFIQISLFLFSFYLIHSSFSLLLFSFFSLILSLCSLFPFLSFFLPVLFLSLSLFLFSFYLIHSLFLSLSDQWLRPSILSTAQ